MADAITDLTATWVAGQGVQLNWTAPDTVTNGSSYQVYVLSNVTSMSPTWTLVTTLAPNVVRASGQAGYSLDMPVTEYLYAFPSPAPVSIALSVIHVDSTGTSSSALNISAFPPPVNPVYGPPHLQNTVSFDPFGQFAVNPQDSYEDVSSAVAMVAGALVGERTMLPDFGIQDPTFTEIDALEIQNAINQWEPRANAVVSVIYDDNNNASVSVSITSDLGSN